VEHRYEHVKTWSSVETPKEIVVCSCGCTCGETLGKE